MSMSTTFGFANVMSVLLSITFDEEGFECSASQEHDAAARGNPDLLDAGADINKPDGRSGRSPLHVASANGLASTVAKLLILGAHPLRKDQQSRTTVDPQVHLRLAPACSTAGRRNTIPRGVHKGA
jgi:ankyrin repeat protein